MIVDTPGQGATATPTPTSANDGGALELYDDNGNGRITCAEARRHGIAPVSGVIPPTSTWMIGTVMGSYASEESPSAHPAAPRQTSTPRAIAYERRRYSALRPESTSSRHIVVSDAPRLDSRILEARRMLTALSEG